MRTRHRFDVAAVFFLFVLSSAPRAARAAEEWILPSNPCGLAVTTDGNVWTAHRDYPSQAYLLHHDPNESVRVDLPQKLIAPTDLAADGNGGLWIIATSGIGHLARAGEVRIVSDTGAGAGAVDSEGRLWAITSSYPPSVDIISSDGSVTKIDPGGFDSLIDIAFGRDGSAWITTWPEVLKVDRDGSVQRFPWEAHSYPWITRGSGDTMVGAGGIIAADGSIRSRPIVGEDGAVGADGRTWVARWRDLVVAVDDAGAEELFPTPGPRTGPWSDHLDMRIAAGVHDDLWATAGSSLRRIEVSEESPDLATRVGDVIVLQHEPNCCFEGSHPVITRHRRGSQPYVFEFDDAKLRGMLPQFTTNGRLVGMTRRTISEDARTWTFVELS